MSTIFFIILALFLIFIGYSIYKLVIIINYEKQKEIIREKEFIENMIKEISKHDSMTIIERIGYLGNYAGKEIASHIRLKDGRIFEYVSLAIKNKYGSYTTKHPEIHIKVDDNLLYRQVIDK